MRLKALVLLIATLPFAAAAQSAAHGDTHWDYAGKYGPVNWGKIDPSYKACSAGKEQSPIDIHGAKRVKGLQPIEFHYRTGPATVEHEGHAIDVDFGRGNYIVLDGAQYELQSVHFHRPSEHAVKGRLADMEAHFVHRSADGKLAVISVLLNEDINTPNPLLATLWTNLPQTEGQSSKVTESVNPGALLPASRAYWTYTGSLTVPPCTEGVKWFVMQQPMTVGRTQLRAFQAVVPLTARPLQDARGRKIEASE